MAEVEILLAIIGALSGITVALVLFVFKSIDKRIEGNTTRINCLEKKMVRMAVLIGLANQKEIFNRNSPLTIKENESVTQAIERYMEEEEESDQCELQM